MSAPKRKSTDLVFLLEMALIAGAFAVRGGDAWVHLVEDPVSSGSLVTLVRIQMGLFAATTTLMLLAFVARLLPWRGLRMLLLVLALVTGGVLTAETLLRPELMTLIEKRAGEAASQQNIGKDEILAVWAGLAFLVTLMGLIQEARGWREKVSSAEPSGGDGEGETGATTVVVRHPQPRSGIVAVFLALALIVVVALALTVYPYAVEQVLRIDKVMARERVMQAIGVDPDIDLDDYDLTRPTDPRDSTYTYYFPHKTDNTWYVSAKYDTWSDRIEVTHTVGSAGINEIAYSFSVNLFGEHEPDDYKRHAGLLLGLRELTGSGVTEPYSWYGRNSVKARLKYENFRPVQQVIYLADGERRVSIAFEDGRPMTLEVKEGDEVVATYTRTNDRGRFVDDEGKPVKIGPGPRRPKR